MNPFLLKREGENVRQTEGHFPAALKIEAAFAQAVFKLGVVLHGV